MAAAVDNAAEIRSTANTDMVMLLEGLEVCVCVPLGRPLRSIAKKRERGRKVVEVQIVKCNHVTSVLKRRWFSGIIPRCHRGDPGSIPGRRIPFFLLPSSGIRRKKRHTCSLV